MNREEKLREFQDFIGYQFENEEYLTQALTTPRLANETGTVSYEYLETLGDAVIKLIFILKLYKKGLHEPGRITKVKAFLESDYTFKKVANIMNLQSYIFKSGNQQIQGTRILADVFEAICGAIFLDSNSDLDLVDVIIIERFYQDFDEFIENSSINIKSDLLEYLQGKFKTNVKIQLEYEVTGLAHDPIWKAKNPKIIDINTKKVVIKLPNTLKSKKTGNKPDAKEDIYFKIMDYLRNGED
ncbi:MAG: ribonuclease III domain-containing protein [Candidatus Thorarchaeota archaeon]